MKQVKSMLVMLVKIHHLSIANVICKLVKKRNALFKTCGRLLKQCDPIKCRMQRFKQILATSKLHYIITLSMYLYIFYQVILRFDVNNEIL